MHGPGMVQEGWERVASCLLLRCPWAVLWARRPAPHSTHRSTPLLASWRNCLREKAGGWGLSFLALSGGARRCSRKQSAIPRAHIPAARESWEHSFSQAPRHTSTASTLSTDFRNVISALQVTPVRFHSTARLPPHPFCCSTLHSPLIQPAQVFCASLPLENHITIQPCSPPKKFAVAWLPVLITCTQSGRFLLGFFSLPMTVVSPAFASRAISHCLAEACHSLVLSILYLTLELSERRSESVH